MIDMPWDLAQKSSCSSVRIAINITPSHKVDLDLPGNEDFANSDQTKDRAAELHQVEKQKK